MNFNKHSELAGQHAFLSPSKYHWIRYDETKLAATYRRSIAAAKGVELHEFASSCIRLRQTLTRNGKTLNSFVNDAIGYRMVPEQVLYYSDNAFGTADAIGFRRNLLRIHDLKTGVTNTSMDQLKVYAALFCLEYRYKPMEIGMELRIYQNDEIEIYIPDPDEITHIMDKIVTFDRRINEIRMEALV